MRSMLLCNYHMLLAVLKSGHNKEYFLSVIAFRCQRCERLISRSVPRLPSVNDSPTAWYDHIVWPYWRLMMQHYKTNAQGWDVIENWVLWRVIINPMDSPRQRRSKMPRQLHDGKGVLEFRKNTGGQKDGNDWLIWTRKRVKSCHSMYFLGLSPIHVLLWL